MYRIKNQDSILGGVCLGVAEHLRTDVTLVRIIFVILFFTPIPVGIAYLVMWALLPKHYAYQTTISNFENSNLNVKSEMSNQTRNGNIAGGLVLIILGAIFSFKTFFDINLFSYIRNMWPLVLVGLGIWIIVKEKDDNSDNNSSSGNQGNPYGGTGSGTSY